jgi:hypothetical protein
MELDFSEKIKNLKLLSAEMQTKDDKPEMAMKNKSVCKVCGEKWGSCAHASDESNMTEESPEHEKKEGPEGEKEEMKSSENCEECGKPESECECEDESMEKSDSAKKAKEESKEEPKDKQSKEKSEQKPEEKNKFPFNKSKASLAEKISNMLEVKVKSHNEKHGQTISFAQISKVYSRGLSVFNNTYKPGVSLHQWAIARVNLFLKMMSGGDVRKEYSLLDSDIASASSETIIESGLESYDFINFSDLEFQLAKISLLEAGVTQSEMNFQVSQSEEKKK